MPLPWFAQRRCATEAGSGSLVLLPRIETRRPCATPRPSSPAVSADTQPPRRCRWSSTCTQPSTLPLATLSSNHVTHTVPAGCRSRRSTTSPSASMTTTRPSEQPTPSRPSEGDQARSAMVSTTSMLHTHGPSPSGPLTVGPPAGTRRCRHRPRGVGRRAGRCSRGSRAARRGGSRRSPTACPAG